ncbi:hypothetical protein G6O67_001198 [Ophiocordyceps sinensis]|uniref:Uncharacterized protein n=1 Tax=Ophiocordyceps sinensis TaxID=72228 RepID=A0A8H4V8J7_9HYPO|nr:hypothetical protein G6O67_001198 [Ophiocordyceps sinensis]
MVQFPQSTFQDFKQSSYEVTLETDVMATVLPVICGSSDIPNKQNVLFTELNPITTHKAVKPKPDFFDGARLQDLGPELRNDQIVRSTVIPTKHHNVPVAPNFFLEAKSPSGGAGVVQRQACYDGAYGARALHALQNYGETEPTYDGNAYAYSSTYHSGTLRLYAHHVTEPSTGEGRPEYHMTQAGAYGLDHNRQAFMDGVKAFRNARDMAKQHRDIFIQAANAKAAQAATMDPADVTGAREEVPASREMLESAGGLDSLVWQYTDDALQAQIADISNCPPQDDAGTADPQIADISNCPPQDDAEKADPQIADISNCPPQDDAGTAAMTRHLGIGMEGDSQIPSQEPAVLDCSTALGTNQRPPKRPRQSVSPPNSKRTQSSMSGTSPSTGPRTVQSAAPTQSGSSESH